MADEERPQKYSKNDLANEVVELMREAARKIVELGDALEMERNRLVECQRLRAMYEEDWHRVEDVAEEHDCWRELLEDFRSGIRDTDEVLAGTVGR